jgi:hypothetical protein
MHFNRLFAFWPYTDREILFNLILKKLQPRGFKARCYLLLPRSGQFEYRNDKNISYVLLFSA